MDGIKGKIENNSLIGCDPVLNDSEVVFNGENNILYSEEGVTLSHSQILFNANNAVAYLGASNIDYKLNVTLNNDTVFHMGKGNGITAEMTVILSEQRHCFIGDNGRFALGVFIRNADPHLIYDCNTKKRINPTKSVYIGDHVWIGQDSLILKGTQIDSGSVIGGGSVVSGKIIPHNSIWAGNPARQIRKDTFWDAACVHQWTEEQSIVSGTYGEYLSSCNSKASTDKWIYEYNEDESMDFNVIDEKLNSLKTAQEKCDYLIKLDSEKGKNRFVHRIGL